jgi:hypothetical protein
MEKWRYLLEKLTSIAKEQCGTPSLNLETLTTLNCYNGISIKTPLIS